MNEIVTFHIYDFADGWRATSPTGTDHIAPKKLNALIEKHGAIKSQEQVERQVCNVVKVTATADELIADGWRRCGGGKRPAYIKEVDGWPTIAYIE